MSARLAKKLADLKTQQRAGFVPFIMAHDPDMATSQRILNQLPAHGADIIELGMPFSDPMADGPTIQAAAIRALKHHTSLHDVLNMVKHFRSTDNATPLILMGYYNPIMHYGAESFFRDLAASGGDGVIVVDVPLEEMGAIADAARANGITIIRLIAPTSLATRLPLLTEGAEGFMYYISMKGVTGVASSDFSHLVKDIGAIRTHTALPIAVGFGIQTREEVTQVSKVADLVVVGSAIVKIIESHSDSAECEKAVLAKCKELAGGVIG